MSDATGAAVPTTSPQESAEDLRGMKGMGTERFSGYTT